MPGFANALGRELNNVSVTENGALGFRTTGRSLLDLNFSVASMRNMPEDQIFNRFMSAYNEDSLMALKWLYFARDVREGLGERRLFRAITHRLSNLFPEVLAHLIKFIPEYGRWDDLVYLLETEHQPVVLKCIRDQLAQDRRNMMVGESISLMAKWLPSANASSKATIRLGKRLAGLLHMKEWEYRKMLSSMRKYTNVVEVKMSAKLWDTIDYSMVPSRANLVYKDAFMRNDEERRRSFLEKVSTGEAKINSAVNFPHDIVHRYGAYHNVRSYDQTLEELWKALPDTVQGGEGTIVVADGSASMDTQVGAGSVTALEVANAIAIYFAERLSGEFHDKYITFSSRPQLVDFSGCNSLRDKLVVATNHTEVSNTDLQAVFRLLLSTAVNNRMCQQDVPANVLVISDMEFDSPQATGRDSAPSRRLFEEIAQEWEQAGYKLPRLIFWNTSSRTGTIPIIENDLGVALVSGFSPNIAKMVMSNQLDPYVALVETLMSPRYEQITLAG